MPARLRPTRFDLLLGPTMAGLSTEADATARMHAGIQSSLGSLVDDVRQDRRDAESKRRYDTTEARIRESQIDLKRELAQQRIDAQREKVLGVQGDFQAHLDKLKGLSEELAVPENQTPEKIGELRRWVDAFPGGHQAAMLAMQLDLKMPTKADSPIRDSSTPTAYDSVAKPRTASTPPPIGGFDVARPAAPPPTPGILGQDDHPSLELAEKAAELEEKHKEIVETLRAAEMKSKSSLLSSEQRAEYKLEAERANSLRITLKGEIAGLKNRAADKAKRETLAANEAAARVGKEDTARLGGEEERGAFEANRGRPFDESQSPSWKKGYMSVQNEMAKEGRVLDRQKEMANVRNELMVKRHRDETDRRESFYRELQTLREQAQDERQDKSLRAQAERTLSTKLDAGISQEQRALDFWSDEYTKRADDPKRYTPDEIQEAWDSHKRAGDALNRLKQEKQTGRPMAPPPTASPSGAPGPQGAVWSETDAKEAAKADVAKDPSRAQEIIAAWLKKVGTPK